MTDLFLIVNIDITLNVPNKTNNQPCCLLITGSTHAVPASMKPVRHTACIQSVYTAVQGL